VIELLVGLSRNPWLLALWLGPVLFDSFQIVLGVFLIRQATL